MVVIFWKVFFFLGVFCVELYNGKDVELRLFEKLLLREVNFLVEEEIFDVLLFDKYGIVILLYVVEFILLLLLLIDEEDEDLINLEYLFWFNGGIW